MGKNFYEILNLDEKLLPYFLKNNKFEDIENGTEYRDEKIKEAYEIQRRKNELEYQEKLEKLRKDKELKIGAKKLIMEKKYTSRKVKEANQRGIESEEEKFREKVIILNGEYELIFKELNFAYENVKTEELRHKYNESIENQSEQKTYIEYMRGISEEIEKEIKEKQIREKYSKVYNYNPELIKTISDGPLKGEKLVIKDTSNNSPIKNLNDARNLKIKQTGTIRFANFMGCESFINEYLIWRTINDEPKVDKVFTNLDFCKLELNNETGKPQNQQYYDCVINKLLSEDAIKGSKHNGGYIGLVEKSENGYDITIDKKLSEEEQENLTAIMIIKNRKEILNKVKNEKNRKGEDR